MFRKISTGKLIIIIAVLLGIVILTKWLQKKKGNRTFKSELVAIDTSLVTSVTLTSLSPKNEVVRLFRDGKDWKFTGEGKTYNVEPYAIQGMLSEMVAMKSIRVAATQENKWGELQVADTNAIRVKVEKDKETLADFMIGKFSYQQPTNPYQRQGTMSTYIRLSGEKEVYVVNGFLRMTFSTNMNTLRNKTLSRVNPGDLTKLTFFYPSDSSFTLIKDNNRWTIDGIETDSTKTAGYLNTLSYLSGAGFIDIQTGQLPAFSHSLKMEGNNIPAPVEIKASPADSVNGYFITSSVNEGAVFSGSNGDIFKHTFISKKSLMPEGK